MASHNEVSVATLSRLIGMPDCSVLLDIRTQEKAYDWPAALNKA